MQSTNNITSRNGKQRSGPGSGNGDEVILLDDTKEELKPTSTDEIKVESKQISDAAVSDKSKKELKSTPGDVTVKDGKVEMLQSGHSTEAPLEAANASEMADPVKKADEKVEPIEYIDLDEIDGSDSDEPPVKDYLTTMTNREIDEDVTEFLKTLGLKGVPDSLELEILKMPPLDLVSSETKHVRELRKVLVYPIRPSDLSHPIVQGILNKESCVNCTIRSGRIGENNAWNGVVLLHFLTTTSATAAIEQLKQFKHDLHFEQGSSLESKIMKLQPEVKEKDWTDTMLMVKNIGESTAVKVLKDLFPDADVIMHKDKAGSNLKGHAYLLYGSAEKANAVLEKYSEKKLELKGRRLILQKWRQTLSKIVPNGMLRLGERRLVMQTMLECKEKLDKMGDKEYFFSKMKYLQGLLDKDDAIRKLLCLPAPTFEQLKKLTSLRPFGQNESNQILKRLLEDFDKVIKEKRENEREESKQKDKDQSKEDDKKKHEDTSGKSKVEKSKSTVTRDSSSTRGKSRVTGRGSSFSSRSDNSKFSAPKRQPIPLLSATLQQSFMPNLHMGLLGVGPPSEPNFSQLFPYQRAPVVQPLLAALTHSIPHLPAPPNLHQPQQLPHLQSPAQFSMNMQHDIQPRPQSLLKNAPSLLGSFPGDIMIPRHQSENDEPFHKVARLGGMENAKDRDHYPKQLDEREQRLRALEIEDHYGRIGSRMTKDELSKQEDGQSRQSDFRYSREERVGSRIDQTEDLYYGKGSGDRSQDKEKLFKSSIDDMSPPPPSDRTSRDSHRRIADLMTQVQRKDAEEEFRRQWEQTADRYDERRLRESQPRADEHSARLDEDSRRSSSSLPSSSMKADPVSLLLNLSQLLAEKLQRDKEKEHDKRGGF